MVRRPAAALVLILPLTGLLPSAAGAPADTPWVSGEASDLAGSHALLDPSLTPLRADPDLAAARFRTGRAPFPIRIGTERIDYAVMAITALPGEALEVAVLDPAGAGGYRLRHAAGEVARAGPTEWEWRAPPEPGIHALRVERVATAERVARVGAAEAPASSDIVHLNVLVMHPRAHVTDGTLHGYRIGRYRERPLRGDPVYLPPPGFVEVDPESEDVLVSPHFTLGQFLCKQPGDPRYLALSLPLVNKLEAVLAAANASGIAAPTFHVMSGFRTPWYNASIGNQTVYSRHLWGDAADIFIDVDGNGDMDDLNGDARSDHRDARILADLVASVESSGSPRVAAGGIGLYRRAPHRGPFVHVDARGHAARW